jgi:hypothetical protein
METVPSAALPSLCLHILHGAVRFSGCRVFGAISFIVT